MLTQRIFLSFSLFALPVLPVACRDASLADSSFPAMTVTAACDDFHALVANTYNFKPTKLSDSEQSAKSAEMDKVWESAKADKARVLPCLKNELKNPDANQFFLFDGATLLVSIDDSDESRNILIDSYSRADLEDLVLQNWIAPILRYARAGYDVTAAGDAWLRARDPKYYLPQHGTLAVDKEIGALAIYGSMDEKFSGPALVRIANRSDHPGRPIAIDILSRLASDEGNAALREMDQTSLTPHLLKLVQKSLSLESSVKPRDGSPRVTRDQYLQAFKKLDSGDSSDFMRLAAAVEDGERDAVVVLRPEDIPLVRKARRFFASTGTPHLEEWYQSFTDIILALMKKRKS